jgi:hypothetical protein
MRARFDTICSLSKLGALPWCSFQQPGAMDAWQGYVPALTSPQDTKLRQDKCWPIGQQGASEQKKGTAMFPSQLQSASSTLHDGAITYLSFILATYMSFSAARISSLESATIPLRFRRAICSSQNGALPHMPYWPIATPQ